MTAKNHLAKCDQQHLTVMIEKIIDRDGEFEEKLLAELFTESIKMRNDEIVKWLLKVKPNQELTDSLIAFAVSEHDIPIITFLLEDCGLLFKGQKDIIRHSAHSLPLLKYLHEEHGWPLVPEVIGVAAFKGRLDVIIYARKNGCDWFPFAASYAAMIGRVDILEYLHTNGCPFDPVVCAEAAKRGHLECLKFAHEIAKCDLGVIAAVNAAEYDHLDCLKYAIDKGCEYNIQTLLQCSQKNKRIVEYLETLLS